MIDINTMFQTKNYEILKNKLNLDINNNADSLNQTMSNYIDLKCLGLNRYLVDNYDNLNIKYDLDEINDLLEKEKKILKDFLKENIQQRREEVASYLDKDVDVSKIDDSYIDKYHQHIEDITKIYIEKIENNLREEIRINFSNTIVNIYKLPDEASKEKFLDYINNFYCNNLVDKITSEVLLRNSTLKNLSKEAFERFKSMNEKTVE